MRKFIAVLTAVLCLGHTTQALADTYKVTVVCDLAAAIKAGKYVTVDSYINSDNYPDPGCKAGQIEIILVELPQDVKPDEVLAFLDEVDLRPATLLELLSLGSAYPVLQREMQIVAPGSSWLTQGALFWPALGKYIEGRGLSSSYFFPGSYWRPAGVDFRFAAVQKPEPLPPLKAKVHAQQL